MEGKAGQPDGPGGKPSPPARNEVMLHPCENDLYRTLDATPTVYVVTLPIGGWYMGTPEVVGYFTNIEAARACVRDYGFPYKFEKDDDATVDRYITSAPLKATYDVRAERKARGEWLPPEGVEIKPQRR